GLRPLDPNGPPTTRAPTWSTVGTAHLLKCVQALMLAGEDEAAAAVIATADALQRDDGGFLTQPGPDVVLHAHFYAVEGLMTGAAATADREALQRARRATEWAWEYQLPSGGLPRHVVVDRPSQTSREQWDVTAQALRAAVISEARVDGLDRAVSRLGDAARTV